MSIASVATLLENNIKNHFLKSDHDSDDLPATNAAVLITTSEDSELELLPTTIPEPSFRFFGSRRTIRYNPTAENRNLLESPAFEL